jgi:hypothetical protein
VESGILYPSELQTIATVIPAFSKATDYVIADKVGRLTSRILTFARVVHLAYKVGLDCAVLKFYGSIIMICILLHSIFGLLVRQDLERVLGSLKEVFLQKVHRVFLLIEGLCESRVAPKIQEFMPTMETYALSTK